MMENRSAKRFSKGDKGYFKRWLVWMGNSIEDKPVQRGRPSHEQLHVLLDSANFSPAMIFFKLPWLHQKDLTNVLKICRLSINIQTAQN